ncbi:WecB/TagA/CpsF family glycosyltransferase [Nocardioides rotundus]|uniref:WecB/TagA/CpsF family glycosyltransferase n=1 Tax=Nocardioides rotundus TaxID=1774216 RepID=UPI001CC05D80|nr:WecB/TagA/CpsF family glycosyltransferase [Nocardioides rotundus]UAL30593.1 WecB/TagA/CpsF family glycosyltransferase [Nocardioides rotundus]
MRSIVDLAGTPTARTAYALHVGGLNARGDRDFVTAMRAGDLVYADGGSVVGLARLAGARHIERAPTTDIGWEILRGIASRRGRPARVALIGGPPGLAERAAATILAEAPGAAEIVATHDGYQQAWSEPLAEVRSANPDVVLVGLGAPREMIWCHEHRSSLPAGAVIVTVGGWFGHVTGDESRAPRLLRRSGLEWIARLAQAPRRLAGRYALGLLSTLVLVPRQLRNRRAAEPGVTS